MNPLGIKETELVELFKDILKLSERDKKAIINAYLRVKKGRENKSRKEELKALV